MRVMALDFGTVRVGVAISDAMRMIAQPFEMVPADPPESLVVRLQAIVMEKEVDLIVVGMPRNMDGSYGPAAEKVRAFIARLQEGIELPIRTWDERLTSVQANRTLADARVRRDKRKAAVDSMAAAILLQSFLDSQPT